MATVLRAILGQKKPGNAFESPDTWLYTGLLILVLLLGAVLLSWAERWRKRQLRDDQNPAESLTSFRELLESGELGREEYDRIRRKVATRAVSPTTNRNASRTTEATAEQAASPEETLPETERKDGLPPG